MPRVRSGERLREYRSSYNYRAQYFKKNPGLFGCIWFCSQCYRPLIGKKNVVIDHIIPLSKGGRNHVSNCTAICRHCNSSKSDKIDGRIAKGAIFKVIESSVFRGQRGVGAAVGLTAGLTAGAFHGVGSAGTGFLKKILGVGGRLCQGAVKAISYPLRKGNVASRLLFLALYVLIVMYLLKENTSLLDAWF